MEHLAILSKRSKLLDKIISGEKRIESRWYKFKKAPFEKISEGDIVYFKESGEDVTVKGNVENVLFFKNLNDKKIKEIFFKFKKDLGVRDSYISEILGKKYCTLIFLKDIQKIKPFRIDKSGFGIMSAWITLKDIKKIKVN